MDGQSFEKDDAGSVLELGQERVENIDMGLGVNLFFNGLVEREDGVSYCALNSQSGVRDGNERRTVDEEIDAGLDSCHLSGGEHDCAGRLCLLSFALF